MREDIKLASKILRKEGVGIAPTDTIYGMLGSAFSKNAVERIYRLRKRNIRKPLIILIGSTDDLRSFGIKIDQDTESLLEKFWPGRYSIILPCPLAKFFYLHRGKKSLAFRLPKNKRMKELLKKTGPLVAPSANPEGSAPANTIREARNYFGNNVDFYISRGKLKSAPSVIIEAKKGNIKFLRK